MRRHFLTCPSKARLLQTCRAAGRQAGWEVCRQQAGQAGGVPHCVQDQQKADRPAAATVRLDARSPTPLLAGAAAALHQGSCSSVWDDNPTWYTSGVTGSDLRLRFSLQAGRWHAGVGSACRTCTNSTLQNTPRPTAKPACQSWCFGGAQQAFSHARLMETGSAGPHLGTASRYRW